jgi:hypothetical protein
VDLFLIEHDPSSLADFNIFSRRCYRDDGIVADRKMNMNLSSIDPLFLMSHIDLHTEKEKSHGPIDFAAWAKSPTTENRQRARQAERK